jgi:hypothetical protein
MYKIGFIASILTSFLYISQANAETVAAPVPPVIEQSKTDVKNVPAQSSNAPAPEQVPTSQPAPSAPVAPVSPTIEPTAPNTATPSSMNNVMGMPDATAPENVNQPITIAVPKFDEAASEKIAKAFNDKNIDQLIASFSKDNFLLIGASDEVISNEADLKDYLGKLFSANGILNNVIVESSLDMNNAIVADVAVIKMKGKINMPNDKHYNLIITATAKFFESDWRFVYMNISATQAVSELYAKKETGIGMEMKMIVIAIIGFAIGMISAMLFRKKAPTA